jgi:hypothetical protein
MMAEETARQAKEQSEKAKEEAVRLAAAQEERKAKVAALQKGVQNCLSFLVVWLLITFGRGRD